jgi:hypothetical protein
VLVLFFADTGLFTGAAALTNLVDRQEVLRLNLDVALKMLHAVAHRLREASPLPRG